MSEPASLTAGELIEALERIDPNTVITWTEHQYEWDTWFDHGITGVDGDGCLGQGRVLASGCLSDEYEEDIDE